MVSVYLNELVTDAAADQRHCLALVASESVALLFVLLHQEQATLRADAHELSVHIPEAEELLLSVIPVTCARVCLFQAVAAELVPALPVWACEVARSGKIRLQVESRVAAGAEPELRGEIAALPLVTLCGAEHFAHSLVPEHPLAPLKDEHARQGVNLKQLLLTKFTQKDTLTFAFLL